MTHPVFRIRRSCSSAFLLMVLGLVPVGFADSRQSPTDSRQAMDMAQRWVDAKFLGEVDRGPAPSHLLAYFSSGTLGGNDVQGRPFRIASQKFTRGLYFPSDGKVHVVLDGPARSFAAVVGIDSNDLGYYSNVGRGAAVASIEVEGKTLFKTQPLREGMAGVPVKVDLNGASEFDLKVEDGGGGVVLRVNFDRTDWADASVTMANGKVVGLADLPLGPLPGPIAAAAPFSFRYADRPSDYLLKTWDLDRATRQLDENRTSTYADLHRPADGTSCARRCHCLS